ncbi:protein LURP-one-related 7-like [Triticum dicoccoides]|uniref:protein LURP-one-related 7-like n=1 Tax=Triticum dicoccoides TaxID=85692 RepID=UPI001890081D|nr:protein LURP-one-related 7-like [Triticum dicoccoides]
MDRTNAAAAAPPPVPMAAPVVPVDLTVVKKLLGGGGDLAVHDASGGLAFRVTAADGCGRRCGGRALLDASGSTLVTARSSEGAWQAFKGISWEQKDIIFSTKVMCASSDRKEVHVFVPPRSTSEEQKPSYILVGNPSRRACTIIRGNSIVAQTNLPYKLNKAVYSRRKFRVTIYPGNDNILIMAMVMTFLVQK